MDAERHLFIADLHFGHGNTNEKFRKQFSSQEDHDNFIHNNIIQCGNRQKTLWILGDSFLKTNTFWRLDEYRKIYQQVNIILGNHCHSGLPRYIFKTDKGGQPVFNNVNVFGSITKFGFWLSHVPVPDYELNRGNNICGHRHDRGIKVDVSHKFGMVDFVIEDDRYFCVSCENIDYKPVSLAEIKSLRGW